MPLTERRCEALATLARVERHLRQTSRRLTGGTFEARFVSGAVGIVIGRFAAREQAPPSGAENHREGNEKDEARHAHRERTAQCDMQAMRQGLADAAAGGIALAARQRGERGTRAHRERYAEQHTKGAGAEDAYLTAKQTPHARPAQRQQPKRRQSEPAKPHNRSCFRKTRSAIVAGRPPRSGPLGKDFRTSAYASAAHHRSYHRYRHCRR